jgi:serine/threonine-protein kinase
VASFYLGLAVEAKRGTLRLMSPDGVLVRMWSGVGSGRGMFPSPPLAMAIDGNGDFWISLYEFGGGAVRLVHCFSPEGELKLSIAPYGTKFGEVLYPVSLAASQEALYVLDAETSSITKFDLAGTPLRRFGEAGRGRGSFDTPRMLIAGRHYLYVLDYGNRQVQRLSLEGEYLSRYAFRRSRESAELRLLGGLGTTTDEHLLVYDADGQKIRKVSLDGQIVASYPLPVLEGEDASSLVEMRMHEGIIYAVRRGANRIHRIQESGTPLPPLEVYAAVRGLDLWFNPQEPKD